MKPIMKSSIKVVWYLLLVPFLSFGQIELRPEQTLNDVKHEIEPYLENLHQQIGDDEFYREGSFYNQYRQWLEYWEPKLGASGRFDLFSQAAKAGIDLVDATFSNYRNPGTPGQSPWLELGPIHRPENGVVNIGNGGSDRGVGPVEFISFYHSNPDKMLCGSINGGLFYSDNAGLTWNNGGSDLLWDRIGCGWAEFHPSNSDIWYAANTLEPMLYERGVYRTLDHGLSWNMIFGYQVNGSGFWDLIYKTVLDQALPNDVLFVATSSGIYKTSNLSNTIPSFTKLTDSNVDGLIFDLEPKLNDHNVLVASVRNSSYVWHVAMSSDGGNTWTVIPNTPSIINSIPLSSNTTSTGSVGVTIETTAANPDYFYFLFDKNANSEIHRYDIATGQWTNLSPSGTNALTPSYGNAHGFGISQIQADEIYVSSDDRYKRRVGGTWTSYTSSSSNKYTYHVDEEDFVGHPSNAGEVWMACHGGVYKSTDNGFNWVNMSEGIAIGEVASLATSITNPEFTLLGLMHDGTVRSDGPYTQNWTPTWRTVFGGDGDKNLIDYLNPKNMWVSESAGGDVEVSNNYGLEYTFSSVIPAPIWKVSLKLNTVDPDVIYFTRPLGIQQNIDVVRSVNQGHGPWRTISNFNQVFGLTNYFVYKIATSPSNPDYLYAYVVVNGPPQSHRLFRTKSANITNPIPTWEELYVPVNNWFGTFQPDPENPDILYMTWSSSLNNYPHASQVIFKIDYTLSNSSPVVSDLTKNLPFLTTGSASLAFENGTDGAMYLGTNLGVFYTNQKLLNDPNSSIGWQLYGSYLPHADISGLEINYVANKLRVGLYGRGLWENNLKCPDAYSLIESGAYPSNVFLEAEHDINSAAEVNNGLDVKYRAGEEIILVDGFHAFQGSSFKTYLHPCNHSGNSFRLSNTQSSDLFEKGDFKNPSPIVNIFPNPARDYINVRIIDSEELEMEEEEFNKEEKLTYKIIVSIKNIMGEEVYHSEIQNNNFTIQTSNFGNGIYFLETKIDDEVITNKIVKL